MAEKAEVVYLDELGNVVPRAQARRVRITLVGLDGSPLREIWGVVHRPGDDNEWRRRESDFELLT